MSYSIQLENDCTTLFFQGSLTFSEYNRAMADVWNNTAYRGEVRQIRTFEQVERTELDRMDAHVFAEMDRIAYRDAEGLSIAFVRSPHSRRASSILTEALCARGVRAMMFSTLSSARSWFNMPPDTNGCRFYRHPSAEPSIA